MANPSVLQADTVLYSAAEPKGRTFLAGEAWPGDAWSMNRGGEPVGKASTAQAMKDLVSAQDTIDNLSSQLDGKTHDLAVIAAERDEANGKVADLEQRAIDAEKAKAEADEAARGYMVERDQARTDLQAATDALTAAKAEAEKVPALAAQLETAGQANANLNGQVEKLTADLAAATAPKAPKSAKGPTDAAADAAQPEGAT